MQAGGTGQQEMSVEYWKFVTPYTNSITEQLYKMLYPLKTKAAKDVNGASSADYQNENGEK